MLAWNQYNVSKWSDMFLLWNNPQYLERTTDHGKATGKLYQLWLRVEFIFFVVYKAGREPTPYW
jgi:hypothetical protein